MIAERSCVHVSQAHFRDESAYFKLPAAFACLKCSELRGCLSRRAGSGDGQENILELHIARTIYSDEPGAEVIKSSTLRTTSGGILARVYGVFIILFGLGPFLALEGNGMAINRKSSGRAAQLRTRSSSFPISVRTNAASR